ncbi:hypothetical protein ACFE04_030140 [Oxalis oulophora]
MEGMNNIPIDSSFWFNKSKYVALLKIEKQVYKLFDELIAQYKLKKCLEGLDPTVARSKEWWEKVVQEMTIGECEALLTKLTVDQAVVVAETSFSSNPIKENIGIVCYPPPSSGFGGNNFV